MPKIAPKSGSRVNVSIPDSVAERIALLAKEVGCSQSAIVSRLASEGLALLSVLPASEIRRELRDTRRLLGGVDGFKQRVLRARGPSEGYIETALQLLLEKAQERHAGDR